MPDINKISKSRIRNGVSVGKNAVARRSSLGPNPAFTNMVVVEVSPKVVLSPLGSSPSPGLFNWEWRSIHIVHIVAISESCHFRINSKGILTHLSSNNVAGDFKSSNWISQSDDSSSPSLIERSIRVIKRCESRIELIEGSIQFFMVNDTSDRKDFSAGSVSLLGVASVAWHSSDKAVLLFRPDCRLESQSLLGCNALSVVRVILLNRYSKN